MDWKPPYQDDHLKRKHVGHLRLVGNDWNVLKATSLLSQNLFFLSPLLAGPTNAGCHFKDLEPSTFLGKGLVPYVIVK